MKHTLAGRSTTSSVPRYSTGESSFEASLDAELNQQQLGGARGGRHEESSFDIDASYPPPHRRVEQPRRGGVGAHTATAASYLRNVRGAATPSPDTSDVDVSLSGSMEYTNPRGKSAVASSAYPTSLAGAARSAAMGGGAGSGARGHMSQSRARYGEVDSSTEELNPDLDDENEYGGASYKPSNSTGYKHLSAHELLTQRAAALKQQQQQQQQQRAPPRRPVQEEDDDEVEIDLEDSAIDIRASNNTLIKKAQQMQEKAEAEEAAERQAKDRARKEAEAAARKAAVEKELADAAAAVAAKKRAEEQRLREQREEEEDRREREEAERAREELRKAAEVADDDDYVDEFSAPDESPVAPAAASKPSAGGIDALGASADDDDAEIERARRQLEAEEEAELAAERRAAELRQSASLDASSDPQLATAAFLNPNFAAAGLVSPSAVAGGRRDPNELSESADLELARQRQEEREEEEAEMARRAELERKKAQLQRKANLEAAVEESYDGAEDEFSTEQQPPQQQQQRSQQDQQRLHAAAHAASQPGPASAAAAAPAVPSVLSAALASLNPQVAAQVMEALQQQLSGGGSGSAGQQSSSFNPYAAPNPYTVGRSTHTPAFDPSQSRAAAAQAWEQLLNSRAAQVAPAPPPAGAFHGSRSTGPAPALPYPPAAPVAVQSWEEMLQRAAAQHVARTTQQQDGDASRLFTKRPLPAAAAATPPYTASASDYNSSNFNHGRFIDQVLYSGLAEDHSRTHLRVENEREALRRLLTFQPYTANAGPTDARANSMGASPTLSRMVADQKSLYLQDQAILNSVLRRVLTAGEQNQARSQLEARSSLAFTPGDNTAPRTFPNGVTDDGRPLPAMDVIRMIEEGYAHAAYDSWRCLSANTLARSVLLAAEPPNQLFTRNVVESTLHETLSELLSDTKVIDMVKKATLKKLKARLTFEPPLQHLSQQQQQQQRTGAAPAAQAAGLPSQAPKPHA